jgi:hypothetical protein
VADDLEEKITATKDLIEGWGRGEVADDKMLDAIAFFDTLPSEQKSRLGRDFQSRLDLTASMASLKRKKSRPIPPLHRR